MDANTAVRHDERSVAADHLLSASSERRFAWLMTAAFLVIAGLTIFRHEMWRDEVQAWMIASDSTTLANLFHNLRYDGHPSLWYLLLYAVGRFTQRPEAMQALHWLLSAGAVFILLRYSPFSRLQKVLIAFSYFPLFEYTVISRNYGIGMLMIFAFCALFAGRRRTLLPISIVLLLLANASAYGMMTAMALCATLPVAWLVDRRSGHGWSMPVWNLALSAAIVIAGLAASLLVMKPAPDAGQYTVWHFSPEPYRVVQTLAAVGSSFVLVPTVLTSWSSFGDSLRVGLVHAAVGGVLLVCLFLTFARRPVALAAYSFGSLIYQALIYTKHTGSLRHHGHFMLLFIACLWLSALFPEAPIRWRAAERMSSACSRAAIVLIPLTLALQCVIGLAACAVDIARPFSMGKAVAGHIRAHFPANMPILGDRDTPASVVAAYLNRPVYYPANGGFRTFVVFNSDRKLKLDDRELMDAVNRLLLENPEGILVVLDYPPGWTRGPAFELAEAGRFEGGIVHDEQHVLYTARPR